MNNIDLLSFAATVASLVLAVVAIALSITFYILASKLSKETTKAAEGISATVEHLEKLFDKFYVDNFSMMRETVSDMRSHLWPKKTSEMEQLIKESEKRADAKIDNLKGLMKKDIDRILKEGHADRKGLHNNITNILDKAIDNTRQVTLQAKGESIRTTIMRGLKACITSNMSYIDAITLAQLLPINTDIIEIVEEIKKLKTYGYVHYQGEELLPSTIISFDKDKIQGYFKK